MTLRMWLAPLTAATLLVAGGTAGAAVLAQDLFNGKAAGFQDNNPWLSGGNSQGGGSFHAKSGGQWAYRALMQPVDTAKTPVWIAITGKTTPDFKGYCFLNPTDAEVHGQMDGVGFSDGPMGFAAGETSGIERTLPQTFLIKVEGLNKRLVFSVWAGENNGAELMNTSGLITARPRRMQVAQYKGNDQLGGLFNAFGIKQGEANFTRLVLATTAAEALGLAPSQGAGPATAQPPLVSPTPWKTVVGSDDRSNPPFVPWPKKVELKRGQLRLSAARIVAATPALAPLAEVLRQEIAAMSGLKLSVASGSARAGDIVLSLDPGLAGEAYRLQVNAQAVVAGGNYGAVALGTASLLEAISGQGDAAALPKMVVEDSPDKAYRGLMIDVARKYHTIESLKQIVELCRLYKLHFLQLHLTDDQGFMFPTRAFPKALTQNQNGGPSYSLQELTDLVAYADARDVTLVPEFDIPGHSAALNRSDRDFWMIRGTKPYEHHASINFARDEVIQACETIIGEMCQVFKSSPYFHIGGDEADYVFADQNAYFQAAFKKLGLGNKAQHELYRRFLVLMDAAVKKNGKRTIAWEGFGREANSKFPIPKDVIVMVYENRFYQPNNLVEDGYTVINASWTPLYVLRVLPEYTQKIFDWNVYLFGAYTKDFSNTSWRQLAPNDLVIGSQVCSWEQPQAIEIANLRWPLAAMSERDWNMDAGKSWPNFQQRLAATDSLLEKLVHTVHWKCEGLSNVEERMFDKSLTLTLSAAVPGTIHYTLDGKAPGQESPSYTAPITLDKTSFVRAALFDAAGKQVGPLTEDHFRQTTK